MLAELRYGELLRVGGRAVLRGPGGAGARLRRHRTEGPRPAGRSLRRAGGLLPPCARVVGLGRCGAAGSSGCILPFPLQPPKDDKKKKDAGKSAKKDKDPVNKSGGKAKKKVGAPPAPSVGEIGDAGSMWLR